MVNDNCIKVKLVLPSRAEESVDVSQGKAKRCGVFFTNLKSGYLLSQSCHFVLLREVRTKHFASTISLYCMISYDMLIICALK